jgi:hypothetical protein
MKLAAQEKEKQDLALRQKKLAAMDDDERQKALEEEAAARKQEKAKDKHLKTLAGRMGRGLKALGGGRKKISRMTSRRK